MNLITVIPITHSKVAETLSYFTRSETPVGAIVSVPLRSKIIHAIVTESRLAHNLKTEIKSASYEIRRLGKVKAENFFPVPFMEAAKKLAHYYVGNLGSVIETLTADAIISNIHRIDNPETPQGLAISRRLKLENTTYAVQGDDPDRISTWRSLIRQEFVGKKSVAIYAPTVEDVESLRVKLTKGIEDYIFTLHGSLPRKKILETWRTIARTEHPIVVIAIGTFAFLPRADIDTIIIERENSRGWVSLKTPYLDIRHSLETIAHESGQVVYLSDSLLRIETLRRLDEKEIQQGSPFKWRSISLAGDRLIDMRVLSPRNMRDQNYGKDAEVEKTKSQSSFRILSTELEHLIRQNRDDSTHLFIYTVRRGLSSTTVCDDCEMIVSCLRCGAPVVLHHSVQKGVNFYLCHICGERRSADTACYTCGGWRLTALGIGIERVEQAIRTKFPDIDLYKIDSDSAPTDKQVDQMLGKFRAKPGSILLGTELALVHIRESLDHSAVASLDSLFALSDFRITERIMYTLTRLRTLSSKSFLVQTRRPAEKVFDYGLKGNLSDFYRGELEERKQFHYPPFQTLIKVTIEGKKDPIARTMAEIKKLLEPYDIDVFPAFTSSVHGRSTIHGLVRVEPHRWPDLELIAKLKTLPPPVTVRIDPESLL